MTKFPAFRFLCQVLFACGALASLPAAAATQVLYSSALGTAPDEQGWLDKGLFGTSATVTLQGTSVAPDLGPVAYGGYSNRFATILSLSPPNIGAGALVNSSFPTLDRNAGFSLTLGFQVVSESHLPGSDRGGFSITLIGSDLMGIAVGFQNDRIFVHNGDLTLSAGENVSTLGGGVGAGYVTRAFSSNLWNLAVNGNTYALTQGSDTVLSGALRNYGAYSGVGQSAYRTPNFLFFGDNTSSSAATFLVDSAAISAAPVPAPSGYAMRLAGYALVGDIARRRARR